MGALKEQKCKSSRRRNFLAFVVGCSLLHRGECVFLLKQDGNPSRCSVLGTYATWNIRKQSPVFQIIIDLLVSFSIRRQPRTSMKNNFFYLHLVLFYFS